MAEGKGRGGPKVPDEGMTRRDLFSIFRRSVDAARAPERASAYLPPPLRPPGALSDEILSETCIRCGACVEICPRQAILPLPETYGRSGGTPYIVARQAPCVLCHGLLCTTVCPSGSLIPIGSIGDVHMGMAQIDTGSCLPWRGTPCGVCHEKCPVPDAISIDDQGRPSIGLSCTGCGLCEYFCPTQPTSVKVRPESAL